MEYRKTSENVGRIWKMSVLLVQEARSAIKKIPGEDVIWLVGWLVGLFVGLLVGVPAKQHRVSKLNH